MKTIKNLALLAAAVLTLGLFASCSDKGGKESSTDTTALEALVNEAEGLLKSATTTLYPEDAISVFTKTVDAVKSSLAKGGLSASTVKNLTSQLNAAISTFKAAAYGSIPASSLTFELTFNEGQGTTLKTTGSNAWTATMVGGPKEIFGSVTPNPTFVNGKVGKAMHFEKGSHLEIADYKPAALEGKELSISVWANPDKVYANNYIISYNYWNSWKFQIQDGSKPFLTLAGDSCVDMDNETDNSAPANTWTHLVVSANLAKGTVDFYVNGQLTKAWTEKVSGTIAAGDGKDPLFIAACYSIETALSFDRFKPEVDGWGCFYGSLDELKVYNTALSAGQVAYLYATEK